MAPASRLFRANFSAALLRSVALATVLLVQASTASAEVVTLICQDDSDPNHSATIRIDYDRKIVDMPNSADSLQSVVGTTVFTFAAATITEGAVEWDAVLKNGYIFKGSLNRLSGRGYIQWTAAYLHGNTTVVRLSGPCRSATKKF